MRLAPLLTYGAVLWVAALVAAPLLAGTASPSLVAAGLLTYRAASVVCHQINERSFHIGGLQLAVCARCLGLYTGAAVASIAAAVVARPDARNSRLRLALAVAPTAAAWLAERGGMWPGTNGIRFVAALPLGFAAAWVVLAAIRAETAD